MITVYTVYNQLNMKTSIMKENENKIDEFEKNLEKLECPFTWIMDDIDETIFTDYKPHDEEEFIPLLKLIRVIMKIYVQTNMRDDLKNLLTILENCDEIMMTIKERAETQFSHEVVYNIVEAMKCFVFWKCGEKEKAKEIFEKIKNSDFTTNIEKSTINACRSICWSKYHTLGTEEAVDFIRRALIDNPEYDLWHFILGKNLRRMRRDLSVGAIPTEEEETAFLNAYKKSKNPVYGIFVAQMFREKRANSKAIQMYKEIFRSKPTSHTIYLRLALGFIQLQKMSLAKMCLDKVAIKYPEDCMYLHYRGHYYMKLKQFQEAIYYLKKAADMNNYPASKEYVRCMMRVNPSFNISEYLISMIEKYKNLPEKQIQNLLLDTAYSYFKKSDLKNALKYFLLSIEVDCESQALFEYYSIFKPGKSQNIFQILAIKVFPMIERTKDSIDDNTLDLYNKIKNYYEQYLSNQIDITSKTLSNIRSC